MISPLVLSEKPFTTLTAKSLKPSLARRPLRPPVLCAQHHNPNSTIAGKNKKNKSLSKTQIVKPNSSGISIDRGGETNKREDTKGLFPTSRGQMAVLCGLGYWVQGIRCFPWLALNFHMAHNLSLPPSTLQLVQNSGNLPMVAKPFYGVLSDALYIGGAHRIPYISIGVLLQVLAWGSLALIPVARETIPALMSCVLLSNFGASITEVAKDALVAEYGKQNRMSSLQSYAFMALAAGGIMGNLLGGYWLLKTHPRTIFLVFSILLSLQFVVSSSSSEETLGLPRSNGQKLGENSVLDIIKRQFFNLMEAIREEDISKPLSWIVSSIAVVPLLSGSIFCYQTQHLHLEPSVIGMSKVIGQLMLLALTVLYDRYLKKIPIRRLIGAVQILFASSLLLDFLLAKQINLKFGISNEVFVLCCSGIAEALAQFRILPFSVLLANLCPRGREGSLTSFLASALCFSSIISGFLGVGLASLIGITSRDFSSLPMGIIIQFLAALLPLGWIHSVPMSQPVQQEERKRGASKRRRKNRRVGRVVRYSFFAYRKERESEVQR